MKTENLYEDILNSLEDGIYYVDRERRFTFWNKGAEKITGYTAAEVVGCRCQDNILDHVDTRGRPLCVMGCPLFATLGDGEQRIDEVLLRHKDGHRISVLVKIMPIYDNGEIVGAAEVFTPRSVFTGDPLLVDQLAQMAMHDALTGLPNRAYLQSFLEHRMEEYKRFGRRYCVLFMDVDDFGAFNKANGHVLGDKVLTSIAASLTENLRSTDAMGRWGGEEFLGVFSIRAAREAVIIGEKVRMLVENSAVAHKGQHYSVTASIGVAVGHPQDTPEEIVERADMLMYRSKATGKNRIHVEDPDNKDLVLTAAELAI